MPVLAGYAIPVPHITAEEEGHTPAQYRESHSMSETIRYLSTGHRLGATIRRVSTGHGGASA
eukprot:833590-Rhodomonas_salina.4